MVPILHCVKGFHPLNSQGGNDFCPLLISLRSIKSPLEVFCDCRPANLIDKNHTPKASQSSPQSQKIFCSLNIINPEETETAFGQTSPAKYLLQRSLSRLGTSIRRIAVSVFRCALDFVTSQPHHILCYDSPIALYPQACECVSLLDYYTLQTVYILLAFTSPTAMTSKDFESPSLSELLYYLGEPHHDRFF